MHLILLSGGSGKRLWPLSNSVRSKQFLKLLPNIDAETHEKVTESMVQRVYRQIKTVGNWESVTIAAAASQKDLLEMQLDDNVNIVIEPERRDTFPAIALACSYLHDIKKVSKDDAVAVLPVDPYVDIDFFKTIEKSEKFIRENETNLLLIGAKPAYPSEKYGYIVPLEKADGEEAFAVKEFKEKPTKAEAEKLIENGALWNCGVFGLKIGYALDILHSKYNIEDFSYLNMQAEFKRLNKTSFDYEVVEHAQAIKAIVYDGQWKDLGTWETLSEEATDNINKHNSNVIMDKTSCSNTYVINETKLPLVVAGVNDAVVVASNDGILVSGKGETHRIKDLLPKSAVRPMSEERRWGGYTVIEHTKYEDCSEVLTKKLVLNAGKRISYQYHNHRKEIWSIVHGKGLVYLEGKKTEVSAGDVIKVEVKQKHAIMAITDLEIIEVQIGVPLTEEDIVRLSYAW